MKKHYYLTLDTETANTLDDPLVYDVGGAIHDRLGNIVETFSFLVYDVFCVEKKLMKTAYYNKKVPKYWENYKQGKHQLRSLRFVKNYVRDLCERYDVKAIIAYNASFDYRALTKTNRYITKSKYRYFLPYGIPIWDSLKMARQTICQSKKYKKFCEENDFLTKTGRVKTTAEVVYRFITNNLEFEEQHTGLEDVLIEVEIFKKCNSTHLKMDRELWKKRN